MILLLTILISFSFINVSAPRATFFENHPQISDKPNDSKAFGNVSGYVYCSIQPQSGVLVTEANRIPINSVYTDENGHYSIDVASFYTCLVFEYVGFEPEARYVEQCDTVINVTMFPI